MSLDFIGSVVSLGCGDVLGTYQGKVVRVNQDNQSVTIEKAFRNGVQCTVPNITINAADILDLRIIKSKDEALPEVRLTPVSVAQSTAPGLVSSGSTHFSTAASKPQKKTVAGHPGTGVQNKSSLLTTSASGNASSKKPLDSRSSPRSDAGTYSGNNSRGSRNSPSHSYRKSPLKHTNEELERNGLSNSYNNGCGIVSPVKGQRGHLDNGYSYGNHHERAAPAKVDDTGPSGHRVRNNSASDCYPVNANKRGYTTPKKNDQRRRTPRDDCFAAPVDSILDEGEFDFEKNLALFNKQAVFDEIENQGYPKVGRDPRQESKYKNDENILSSKPAVFCQIKVPGTGEAQREFVTDSGLVVPCISYETRCRLLLAAEANGYSRERQIETVGRSASEMVLQLIGGSHRLNPQNAHQRPSVVVLCGPHMQGAQGVNCARHLAAHNVNVTLFMPHLANTFDELQNEIKLYNLSDSQQLTKPEDLPSLPVDIIVNALDAHNDHSLYKQAWYQTVVGWTNQNKAPVLGIDPPVGGGPIDMKWSLSVCLPLSLSDKCGQIYLCDLSVPTKIYKSVGIKYLSPFAHKFLVPLHRS